jgi:hypothetical protein
MTQPGALKRLEALEKVYRQADAELMAEAQRIAEMESAIGWDATLSLVAGEAGCTVAELVATVNELRAA